MLRYTQPQIKRSDMKPATKQLTYLTIIGSLLIAVSACGERAKTVDYFKEHPKEIQPMLDECKNKAVNIAADTIEARNCRAAELAKLRGYFKDQGQ